MDKSEHTQAITDAIRGTTDSSSITGEAVKQALPEVVTDELQVDRYPAMPSLDEVEDLDEQAEKEIREAVQQRLASLAGTSSSSISNTRSAISPDGFAPNAEDAPSTSEEFVFWAPADQEKIGIGTIVRHEAKGMAGNVVETYAIVVESEGRTLGLDSMGIDPYENDGVPPLQGIQATSSRRRPVVYYWAKVLSSNTDGARPVLAGPVIALTGKQILAAHLPLQGNPRDAKWLKNEGMLLGFYEDGMGGYGIFAEERARVLGPKQGHIIFSGTPGSGKTSQYLTLLLSLYASLRTLSTSGSPPPGVASIAFNVKGADLLFLDHQNPGQLQPEDMAMWNVAGVNPTQRAFGRVHVLVPLATDGLNRHSLRNNPAADVPTYSTTSTFALGISDLWPYLDLLFDDRSSSATNLLAEIRVHFEGRDRRRARSYSLAQVLDLFTSTLLPTDARKQSAFDSFNINTIRAVYQRLQSLGATLGGLVDLMGTGFGLDALDDLRPYDLVVVDLERLLANPPDAELADTMLKIVTSLVLHKVTESVTRGRAKVNNVIVFADELNTLAPVQGHTGVGEYLAHLARTTRDRGVVLFGAGQFRSGINKDLLKAASVHFSMQTPEYELQDAIYSNLSSEMKSRLTTLLPGHTLLQFPSMRKPVFARFPRPFVLAGVEGLKQFPMMPLRPLGECIAERLKAVDPSRAPRQGDVVNLVDGLLQTASDDDEREDMAQQLQELLRAVEMEYAASAANRSGSTIPWDRYRKIAQQQLGKLARTDENDIGQTPAAAFDDEEDNE